MGNGKLGAPSGDKGQWGMGRRKRIILLPLYPSVTERLALSRAERSRKACGIATLRAFAQRVADKPLVEKCCSSAPQSLVPSPQPLFIRVRFFWHGNIGLS
ncbi:hypothetical protein FNW02_09295 [Komarekiella sp. 'clone 1']|uniref:Uncharacterized protein n=1 Tax=Komarekiella delphini-convector SJRDD-AB1 TaxID=2593771 RepID=A0AA40VQ75_9NOST|nr:hypothetical protein [Komarekiella delphini-convector SJRDD-AB1]